MTPILAFDIETVPDIEGLRRLNGHPAQASAAEIARAAFERRRELTGSDFLPLHLHRVVAISCALRDRETFRIWSLGEPGEPEKLLLQRFYDGIEKYTPQLVSWNGSGFDLPVLNYRALVHGVRAARFWDQGEDDRDFKWNNYISRYHARHLDLMDLLAMYQGRGNAPLDQLSQLAGLPGKLGMDGSRVWEAYQAGQIAAIRNYCETDVVNTYLLFQRFQLVRGFLDEPQYRRECDLVRATLSKSAEPHWLEFLAGWNAG
ncbi:MAG TPA: 3'-5' exonuclease [Burkholderiales bacterium]|nr:3'-5' exonuclease [Burkholderiales bacterium]